MTEFPQILLLGNGINIACGSASWNELLQRIAVKKNFLEHDLKSPMPLKAVLLTGNCIDKALRNEQKTLMGCIENEQQAQYYREILTTGFDHILTTNYSYELEIAASMGTEISEYRLKKISAHTAGVKSSESRYMLHTYNRCTVGEVQNKVWHIHGEARKPNSMILGHYHYGILLAKIKELLIHRGNKYFYCQQKNIIPDIESWVDAFILGDVYVLGFGYNLSEFDLWWLLARKNREKAKTGKLYYFAPSTKDFDEKLELLKVYEDTVEHVDCGITIPENIAGEEETKFYQDFYKTALHKIKEMMRAKELPEIRV